MEPYNFGFVDPFLSRIKTHKLERIKIIVSIPENDFEKLICPLINADKPKTPNILNIFEPTTLPIATLPLPLIKEAIVTANSGRDVPIAARLIPIIASGIFKTSEI
jgi:hypothetical protein|tara:strand:+ start:15264 stop:15581 length:318 start_codon:yes stop_codon:yes gene_type:complete